MNKWLYLLTVILGFMFFGIGSIILSLFALTLRLLPISTRNKELYCRSVVGACFRAFLNIIVKLNVIELKADGLEAITQKGGRLIIANHPSLIDVVILISCMPQSCCVVKAGVWSNPLMGIIVRTCGYIPINSEIDMIGECAKRIHAGETLIIFPEGTRTNKEFGYKLARGAAYVALAAQKPVEVVKIDTSTQFLTKEVKWYNVPKDRTVFRVRPVCSWDVDIHLAKTQSLAARTLTKDWTCYFQEGGLNASSSINK